MILIDAFYFYLEARRYSPTGLDITKLMEYLRANGYNPKTRKWITSYNEPEAQNFYTWLKSYNGPQFEVIIKGTKEKRFICCSCYVENYATVEKGNDVQVASEILQGAYTNKYDTLLLVAGDGDFEVPVKIAKELGKKIVIIGNSSSVSTDLQYLADEFIQLDKIRGLEK